MSETATTTRLWEVDHPYYCSESNYYVGGAPRPGHDREGFVPYDHQTFESWADFGWKDSDPDLNLLFRWDWQVPDPEDCDPDDEEPPVERLELFWMLQRKGRFMVVSFPVQREEEPEIREWLQGRFEHMLKLWEPFNALYR